MPHTPTQWFHWQKCQCSDCPLFYASDEYCQRGCKPKRFRGEEPVRSQLYVFLMGFNYCNRLLFFPERYGGTRYERYGSGEAYKEASMRWVWSGGGWGVMSVRTSTLMLKPVHPLSQAMPQPSKILMIQYLFHLCSVHSHYSGTAIIGCRKP